MPRLLLIDTQNFLHRAFYAYPMTLILKDGTPINAVYGLANMLLSLIEELKPTHMAAAMETKEAPVFRELEYVGYKATRVPKPEEEQKAFDAQLPLAERLLETLGIKAITLEGYEADDVLGAIAEKSKFGEIVIASNDRDVLQLVGGNVRVYLPGVGKKEGKLYGEKEVIEDFGLRPSQIADFKALRGDPSDNIKGVRGIGEKTALSLLQKFSSIEEIYQNLGKVEPESVRLKLSEDAEAAVLSKRLATIATDAPLEFDLKDYAFDLEKQKPKIIKLFEEWGFKSLIGKMRKEDKETPQLKLL